MTTMSEQAINDSIAERRTVHLEWSLGLERDMRDEAEGQARSGDVLEFWGRDRGGSNWSVHLDGVKESPELAEIINADDFAERVEKLQREAGQAGDLAMVNICSKALGGDTAASAECAQVMLDAQAME